MSEQKLPTLEQIDAKIPECYQRVGLLDAEWRKVAEPYNEYGQRLQQIEAEKKELHRIIANLEHTRKLVVEGEKGGSDDTPSQDSE
jgi:hypothetical protein